MVSSLFFLLLRVERPSHNHADDSGADDAAAADNITAVKDLADDFSDTAGVGYHLADRANG